jgi:hypothetical protein
LFYWTAGRYVRRRRVASLLWVGPIMLFGMGISANNAVAGLRGLFAKGGTFVRTPKYGTQDEWWRTQYSVRQPISQLVFEVSFFLYLCSCAAMTWLYLTLSSVGAWKAMTFPVLFATGTGCVIAMTGWHLVLQSRGSRATTTSGGGVRPPAESHDTAGV